MTPEELLSRLPDIVKSGAARNRGGLMLLRLDRARMLRDRLGYAGMIELLEGVAEHARGCMGEEAEAIRFDWSSVIILLTESSARSHGKLAKNLFSSIGDRSFGGGGEDVALTISLAHAGFDHRFTGVDDLLVPLARQAEEIEEQGGNAMAEVRPGISARKALTSRDHMMGLLMEALRTDSMRVVFQPLLATSGNDSVENYQMLPRLAAGDGKLITAGEFVPLAREASLLPVIDRWMTVHAMQLLRGALQQRDVRLFINQSEVLLSDAERREWLDRHLASAPGLAGHIVLELPLEDAMAHMRGARELLDLAKRRDVGICLSHVDEHSRWDLLHGELQPDFVRMSATFVSRLSHEPSLEKRFVKLSEPVRDKGARIIMPMIEDQQTAASMWRSGADYMQGNMIQAPEDSIGV